jgi:hypothetical protein
MKEFPVLNTNGETIPYELVKKHEKQVMINHGGQTVERISERGGLDWVELFCVLNDRGFDSVMPIKHCKIRVIDMVEQFKGITADVKPHLRPCVVKLQNDPNGFEVDAHFHRWCEKSKIIEPSILVGGGPGGVISYVVAIIEYGDGTIDECNPKDIKFMDRG